MGSSGDPTHGARNDVLSILKKQEQDECKEYDVMLNVLVQPKTETAVLTKYISQLKDCVNFISKRHEILVGIILEIDWLSKDYVFIGEYKRLLLNLISAHPYYLQTVVRMLIKTFFPSCTAKGRSDCEKLPDEATQMLDKNRFSHAHNLLQAVVTVAPASKAFIMQMMVVLFPYHTYDIYTYEVFTKNLLRVIQYMPSFRQKILQLLVEKMLHLDVRSSRKDIKDAEEMSAKEDDGDAAVFQMEDVNDEGEKEMSTMTGVEEVSMNHDEAVRLDILMDLTFSYIHATCHSDGKLNWEATKELYRELLAIFDQFILRTHASCHVQFLLFYIISFHKSLLEGFLDYLWKNIKNPVTQNLFRQASAGYLGSILARASYVHINTVKEMMKLMVDWLHEYLHQLGNDVHADVAHHAPFYAVCQAVFYIFCFKNQQLLELKKGHKWAESLGFQRLVSCRLNPLKVCFHLVCTTFASVTRMHQLALCDTIIQRNTRAILSSEPSLEAYFPFDPYLLKRSSKWITALYKEYEGNLPELQESDDEDDDDFMVEEEAMETSPGAFLPLTQTGSNKLDFLKYGTSPGFKLQSHSSHIQSP